MINNEYDVAYLNVAETLFAGIKDIASDAGYTELMDFFKALRDSDPYLDYGLSQYDEYLTAKNTGNIYDQASNAGQVAGGIGNLIGALYWDIEYYNRRTLPKNLITPYKELKSVYEEYKKGNDNASRKIRL